MPLIVVLRGVTPSDLVTVEQFFYDQLLSEDVHDVIAEGMQNVTLVKRSEVSTPTVSTPEFGHLPRELVYLSLPVGGYQIQQLPPKTNLKCWYCDLQFDGHPWFIPCDMREEKNNQVVLGASGISGNFCSEVCAYGWLPQLHTGAIDRYAQLLQTQVLVRKGVTSFVPPDPLPKTEREEYGGVMTVETYREEVASRCIGG